MLTSYCANKSIPVAKQTVNQQSNKCPKIFLNFFLILIIFFATILYLIRQSQPKQQYKKLIKIIISFF